MTRRDPNVSLHHMLDHARRAVAFTRGRTRADLDTDELLNFALVRLVEIIGEAATRVPAEIRARLTGVPWSSVISTRNRLVHGYDTVNLDTVWDIIMRDLPPLIAELERALGEPPGGAPPEDAP